MKRLPVILPFDAKIPIPVGYILYVRSISMLSVCNKQLTDVSSVGTLFGIVLLHTDSRALVLPAQLALILEQPLYDINTLTKSLSTIVPDIDINWSRIEVEWESPKARIPEPWKLKSDLNEQAN